MSTNEQRRAAAKRKIQRRATRQVERAEKRRRIARIVAIVVVVAVVISIAAITLISSAGGSKPTAAAPPPAASGPCVYQPTPQEPASRPVSPPADTDPPRQGTVTATLNTSQGAIPLTLNRAQAPCTVENFTSLAKAGFFTNTPCHRLTSGGLNVLQCGDPTGSGSGGPGYTIPDELPTTMKPGPDGSPVYPAGTVAMANTGSPNTGGSQFFLVYADSGLPPQYTIFGTIAPEGLQVLKKIAAGGETPDGDGKPTLNTTIQNVALAG